MHYALTKMEKKSYETPAIEVIDIEAPNLLILPASPYSGKGDSDDGWFDGN